jgi:hypothetical protein
MQQMLTPLPGNVGAHVDDLPFHEPKPTEPANTFKAVKYRNIGGSSYFVMEDAEGYQQIGRASNVGKTNLEHERLLSLAHQQVRINNMLVSVRKPLVPLPETHPFAIAARLKAKGLRPDTREFRRVYRKEARKLRT